MSRARRLALNSNAIYHVGTGCVSVGAATIELTVAEEELFELLLVTPKVTVTWSRIEFELARSKDNARHLVRRLRDKLGTRAFRSHRGKGVSVQPQFVGSARFVLASVRKAG